MKQSVRAIALRVLHFFRDAWLIFGIAIGIIVVAEVGYRTQGAVRTALRNALAPDGPPDPLAANDWHVAFFADEAALRIGWTPYVYWRYLTFTGRAIAIDSAGLRVTPQKPSLSANPVRVYFYGGSTMWGWPQLDEQTLPAEAARRLQADHADVTVKNLGEIGYIFTQELIDLMLRLRAGERPDVVVFYDGINDVAATLENGTAGIPQNEVNRRTDFAFGRALDQIQAHRSIREDTRAAATLMSGALNELMLVQRLARLVPRQTRRLVPVDSSASRITQMYTENVRIVESLARTYAFTPIYVWQPALLGASKPLTANEQRLYANIMGDGEGPWKRDVNAFMSRMLDSAIAPLADARFVNAANVFLNDSSEVFVDEIGHTTESAVPKIVDRFWPTLEAQVALVRRRRAGGP